MPSISAFPACCGAAIITGFSFPFYKGQIVYNPTTGQYDYPPKAETKEDLVEHLMGLMKGAQRNKMYVCIITENQLIASNNLWLEAFRELGFRFLSRSYNSSHSGHNGKGTLLFTFGKVWGWNADQDQPPAGWELPTPAPAEAPTPKPVVKKATKPRVRTAAKAPAKKATPRNDGGAARDPFGGRPLRDDF